LIYQKSPAEGLSSEAGREPVTLFTAPRLYGKLNPACFSISDILFQGLHKNTR